MEILKACQECPAEKETLLRVCFEQVQKINGTLPDQDSLLTMAKTLIVYEQCYLAFLPIKQAVDALMECADKKEQDRKAHEALLAESAHDIAEGEE